MRWLGLLVLLAIVAQPAVSHGGAEWPPANHSPSLGAVAWSPQEPPRGQSVQVLARLDGDVNASALVLRVCRVESYSCLQPIEMGPSTQPGVHEASVPWNAAFFRGVERVGVAILVRHANGTDESSPVADWPSRPAELPPEADRYYYYHLPAPPADSTALGFAAALAALAAMAAAARRRA